jgi:8-oxo-dGTP diphosphatase
MPSDAEVPPVRVGIALIRRGDTFLVRRRPGGAPLAGLWEFPGGKCEPGEPPEKAAVREALEESGIEVRALGRRALVGHDYSHGRVELHYYDCQALDHDSEPLPGSGFRWVRACELRSLAFPDANATVLDEIAREFGEDG